VAAGESIFTARAGSRHPARGGTGQCQPGLPGGRHLPGPVRSLAPTAGGLRGGRRASLPPHLRRRSRFSTE